MQRIEQQSFGAEKQCDGSDPRESLAFLKWVQQKAGNSIWEVTTASYDARDNVGSAGTAMIPPLEAKLSRGVIGVDGKTANDGAISIDEYKLLSTLKRDREGDLKMQENTNEKAAEIMKLMMEGSKGNLRSAIAAISDAQGNPAFNTSRRKMTAMLKRVKDDYCGTENRRNTTTQVDADMKRQPVATSAEEVRILLSNYGKLREEWDAIYQSGIAHHAQPPPDYHTMKHYLLERINFGEELTEVRRPVVAAHVPETWEELTSVVSRILGATVMPLLSNVGKQVSMSSVQPMATGGSVQMMAVGNTREGEDRRCRLFGRTGACSYGKECRYLQYTPGHPTNEPRRGRPNFLDPNNRGRAADRSRSSSRSDHRTSSSRLADSRSRSRDRDWQAGRESQRRGRSEYRHADRGDNSDSGTSHSRSHSRGANRSHDGYVADASGDSAQQGNTGASSRAGHAGGTPKKQRRN